MDFDFPWIESLGFELLVVAFITACSSRLKKRRWQLLWPILATGFYMFHHLIFFALLFALPEKTISLPWIPHFTSRVLCGMLGISLILYCGLWRRKADAPFPSAQTWSRKYLITAVAIAWSLMLIAFRDMNASLKADVVALRSEAAGLALTVAPQPVHDSQNAALWYGQAFERMPKDDTPWEVLENWRKFPEKYATDVDFLNHLQKHEAALAITMLASHKTHCRFERNFSNPSPAMPLPELSKMKTLAQILNMRSEFYASEGRFVSACKDVAVIQQIANHLRAESILVSLVCGFACDAIAERSIERLVNHPIADEEAFESLKSTTIASRQNELLRALQMEEATTLMMFAGLADGSFPGRYDLNWSPQMGLTWFFFMLPNELTLYREKSAELRKFVSQPLYWINFMDKKHVSYLCDSGFISKLYVPGLPHAIEFMSKAEAGARLADLGVAMVKYRIKHGGYPDTLDKLVPDYILYIPTDPFSGKPLKMVVADGGIVLYSFGPDCKDDEGEECDETTGVGDLTFCLGEAFNQRRRK